MDAVTISSPHLTNDGPTSRLSARVEIEGDFYAPTSFGVVPRVGDVRRYTFETQGRGLHYEASHVAQRIRAGETESDVMPLDETIDIMRTMLGIIGA